MGIQEEEKSVQQRAEQELLRAKESLDLKSRELALSLARMQATLEAATDGILVTDSDHRVTDLNRRYSQMWQVPADVMETRDHKKLSECCSRLFPQPSSFIARLEEIHALSPAETFDVLELADGRIFERFSRIQFLDREAIGRVWTFRDITERKRLEEGRARLAAVVESSNDAIISKTLEGIITTWNKSAEWIFGYRAEEVIGKSVTILMPKDRVSEEGEILRRLRAGERIENYETIRIRKDGTLLNISLTVSPVRDPSGKIIGVSKIARDVTARKRMEQKLRDDARILELLNTTGTAIASKLDLEAVAQTVVDATTQLSGAKFGAFFFNVINSDGETLLLYTLSGLSRADFENCDLPGNTSACNATFRGEPIVRSSDITRDPRFGKKPECKSMPDAILSIRSYLAVPVVSRSGNVLGALLFGHPDPDVFTEQTEKIVAGVASQAAVAMDNARLYDDVKRASEVREKLLEAERTARAEAERVSLMKDEFLATLSHELRTPLNAILGWSQILRAPGGTGADLEEGLSVIERNTRVQTQLIEDLLDMSRIISGKIRLDVQRVDLQDVVKAAVASVRHSAESKGIRLQIVLDPLAGPAKGDPDRLQQCFWNLLSNAIKFTPKGGRIQVTLERVNSHLEVCVADNGQGIEPDFLPHVFERFRQADSSTTREQGGLGIGLSIVKSLVELHGGSISVKSPGPGQGSTFCIELPLMLVRQPESTAPREHPARTVHGPSSFEHPSLEGISVLAVDDEADARNLLKRILEGCGARVFLAASAEEGLALVSQQRPHMIISDIGMPGQDGYEFIRRVRKLSPEKGGRTPAAALTAFARAEDRTRALRAGYQTHVAKPVEPSELTAVVASLATSH